MLYDGNGSDGAGVIWDEPFIELYVDNADDCNDGEPLAWTGATEVCDGVDNNCTDGELDAIDQVTWYADTDSDTYGDPITTTDKFCDQPSGYVSNADDCNDTEAMAWSNATKSVMALTTTVPMANWTPLTRTTWYADTDTDTYGDRDSQAESCDQPSGYVSNVTIVTTPKHLRGLAPQRFAMALTTTAPMAN